MKLGFLSDFDFFTGVPDSLLKPFCDWVIDRYGIGKNHIIAANEGNAVALAAGYHLATGKVPVVYMQNSGEGNIINPVASLMNDKVYGIPCVFIVGWRGEPNVPDEPQHIYQGEVTVKLLEDMDIKTFIISKDTSESEVKKQLEVWKPLLESGKQVAFPLCNVQNHTMEFYLVNSLDDLQENGAFGTPEPKEHCEMFSKKQPAGSIVCVVPTIVYDPKGYRLGYGKGFYDRYLSDCPCTKVGMVYSDFMVKQVPRGRFDLSVDVLVTEKGVKAIHAS